MALKILKWVGIVLGSLIGIVVIAVVVLYFIGSSKVNKTYAIEVAAVTVPTGAQAVERGRHFVEAIGLCMECHTDSLGGDIMDDDPVFGTLVARNLTSGQGGIGGTFTDLDYVRAIRHGLGQDDKALVIMPSEAFNKISDTDLGAIIAYLKSLPPVDNELPETSLAPVGRIFTLLDGSLIPATLIDHEAPRPPEPEIGVTKEYGDYLAFICSACHGENLSGGPVPGADPNGPLAPNLTPGGALGSWTDAQFISTLRTGVTPSGKQLDNEFMFWETFRNMTDDELGAIWLYLQSLPAREFEG